MGGPMSSTGRKVRVGLVGCGVISGIYFENLSKFGSVDVVACSDLVPELSEAATGKYPGIRAVTTGEILGDSSIDLVLNLTQSEFHFAVMKAGIEAGKHVYGEKPLCGLFEESVELMAMAEQAELRIGGAPDTYPPLLQLPPTARWHRRGCTGIKTVNNVCGNYT